MFAPEKDERGGVELDVNDLLSLSSLSWTLDGDSRSKGVPQFFHDSGQNGQWSMQYNESYRANTVIGFFLGGTVGGKNVSGICCGTLDPTS